MFYELVLFQLISIVISKLKNLTILTGFIQAKLCLIQGFLKDFPTVFKDYKLKKNLIYLQSKQNVFATKSIQEHLRQLLQMVSTS